MQNFKRERRRGVLYEYTGRGKRGSICRCEKRERWGGRGRRNSKDLITVRQLPNSIWYFSNFPSSTVSEEEGDGLGARTFPHSRDFPPGIFLVRRRNVSDPACDLSRWESAHWQVGHFSFPRGKTPIPPPSLLFRVDFCSSKVFTSSTSRARSVSECVGRETMRGEEERGGGSRNGKGYARRRKFTEIYSTLTHYIFHGGGGGE